MSPAPRRTLPLLVCAIATMGARSAIAGQRIVIRAHAADELTGKMMPGPMYAQGSLTGMPLFPDLDAYNTGDMNHADAAAYDLYIPTDGFSWYVWARLYYPGTSPNPTNDPNSFWIAMDDGIAKNLGDRTDTDKVWHWEGSKAISPTGPLVIGGLAAGRHRLLVWSREARERPTAKLSPRLDVIVVTETREPAPTDADIAALVSAPLAAVLTPRELEVDPGDTVTLDGTGSTAPKAEEPVAAHWVQWTGPAAITLGGGLTQTFVVHEPGTYGFLLALVGAQSTSRPAEATVRVRGDIGHPPQALGCACGTAAPKRGEGTAVAIAATALLARRRRAARFRGRATCR